MARVNQTFDPATVYSFHTVSIIRYSTNWTLVAFALELSIGSGSPEAFAALYNMYVSNGQYLAGGGPTDALLITPSSECICL